MPPQARTKRRAGPTSSTPAKRTKQSHSADTADGTADAPRTPHLSGATSRLERLPDELLLMILDQLKSSTLRPNLNPFLSLCLTNRRLNGLANDYLYEHLSASNARKPGRFLKTIVANPELARRVKKLTWLFRNGNMRVEHNPVPTSAERRNLRESLKRLGVIDRQFLETRYIGGYFGEMLQIILLHTLNLRELTVLDGASFSRYLYSTTLRDAATGKASELVPVYPHLRSVSLDVNGIHLRHILSMLRFPSLRSFQVARIDGYVSHSDQALLTELYNQSSVTELVILDSFCDADILSHLIAACRRLKTFILDYDFNFDVFTAAEPTVTKDWYPKLIGALRKHETTLEKLALNDDTHRWDDEFEGGERGLLGDLKSFSKLRDFSAPLEAFERLDDPSEWGTENDEGWDELSFTRLSDVLPPSIEKLSLTMFGHRQIEFCKTTLLTLVAAIPMHFPHLHQVGLRGFSFLYVRRLAFEEPKFKFSLLGVDFWHTHNGIPEELLPGHQWDLNALDDYEDDEDEDEDGLGHMGHYGFMGEMPWDMDEEDYLGAFDSSDSDF